MLDSLTKSGYDIGKRRTEKLCLRKEHSMDEVIKRINELARKAKTEGLTEEELQERDILRRKYLDSVRNNLIGQLENTYIVEPDGTKHKLKKH